VIWWRFASSRSEILTDLLYTIGTVMASQAAMTLLDLTRSAATEAIMCCSLLVMWWALGVRGAPPALGAQKHAEAGPTDLDLGIDFEAFQAQVGRRCDLQLDALCKSAMDDHSAEVPQNLEEEWRRCDLELDALCESTMDDQSAEVLQDLEDEWRRCDLELDALCESTMDDQSAKVPQDLEDEFGGGPVVAQTTSEESALDFEANVGLHCDRAIWGMRSHAKGANHGVLDGMCAAVLKALEDEYTGSGTLDNETQGYYVSEMEEAL
jgi:hypothetical protein